MWPRTQNSSGCTSLYATATLATGSIRTMAVSASISKRCGLTARMAAASATTRVKSMADGLMMAGGGMAVWGWYKAASGLGNYMSNLAQFGQKHVGAVGGVLDLLGRRFQ